VTKYHFFRASQSIGRESDDIDPSEEILY